MKFKDDDFRITYNEVLNRIFAGYITNELDVYNFIADYNPHMEVKDVFTIVEDLKVVGKI